MRSWARGSDFRGLPGLAPLGNPTPSRYRIPPLRKVREGMGHPREDSALGAQNLAQPLIDFYCVLRGLIDHFEPAARTLGQTVLRNQISGLHDGFEGIAEIVREYAKFLR